MFSGIEVIAGMAFGVLVVGLVLLASWAIHRFFLIATGQNNG